MLRVFSIFILLNSLSISVSDAQPASPPSCYCASSNSTYATTATTKLTTVATATSAPGTSASTAASNSGTSASTAASNPGTSTSTAAAVSTVTPAVAGNASKPTPTPTCPAFTQVYLNITSQLSLTFGGFSLSQSTPGFSYDLTNNQFTVPQDASERKLVIDLYAGPSGIICRPMPLLEWVCVSSNCSGCNLNKFTAAAATTLYGDSAFLTKVFYPTTLTNRTVCQGRDILGSFDAFQYLVILPIDSPLKIQPFKFSVQLAGNFSAFNNNGTSRRRRSASLVDRFRRAVPLSDCWCPIGQDPVFPDTRTAVITWVYTMKPFIVQLANTGSAEYVSLASETYNMLTNAVRNTPASNLTSVISDFTEITFSRAVSGSTKVTGSLVIRNDIFISNDYVLKNLVILIQNSNYSVANFSLKSEQLNENSPGIQSALPVYAAVLIALLGIATVITVAIIVLWRLDAVKVFCT